MLSFLGASLLVRTGVALHASAGMELRGSHVDPVVYEVQLIREMDHVGAPFTQGLEFTDDCERLIETSGSYPAGTHSFVRTLDPHTGEVLMTTTEGLAHADGDRSDLTGGRFIEGIAQLEAGAGSHWFATTYMDQMAVEYDSELNQVDEHPYPYEGWGFARNADRTAFFATNGSEHVMELTPSTFEVASVKTATCYGRSVSGINELEMVHDFQGTGHPALLGNIYTTRAVVALDPETMSCIGIFQLEGLGETDAGEGAGFHVANGIAFNRHTGNYILTGKNWAQMFEVRLQAAGTSGRAREIMDGLTSSLLQADAAPTGRNAKPHVQKTPEEVF